ncbi:hypothetical protein JKP88DRAFT_277561 [Tribonema minus]|uniref:Uncharacterized protein n=1 Tax=Tribonema minus TaxID=303371 RepID=A0A835Z0S8_9STRA|nr:hypothetical protein JKP88DRAFT_277561 [Tribonema minus]
MRVFFAKMGKALWAVFAEPGEAKLAAKAFTGGASGSLPFWVTSIEEALRKGAASNGGRDLQLVVQPGFNIDEWIQWDTLYAAGAKARQAAGAAGQPSMVVLNGSLDKVRGGYYPKLFYPGLHAAKDRFIKASTLNSVCT